MGVLANQLWRTKPIWEQIRSNVNEKIKNPSFLSKVWRWALDISSNIYEWTENLSVDVINEWLELFWKKPIKPLREQLVPTWEDYNWWLLKRSVDTIQKRWVELWEINTETVEWNQTVLEWITQSTTKLARWVFDIAWDSFITWLSTLTPDEQKRQLNSLVQEMVNTEWWQKTIETIQILQEKYNKFKKENPRAWRNTDAIWTFLEWAIALTWFWLVNKWIQSTQKTWQELTEKLLKNIPWNIKNIPWKIDNKIQETWEKLLIKMQNNAMKKNQLQAEEATSRILQWETKDIIPALKTFNKIDLKDVNDYKWLWDKVNTNLKNIVETQDELLKAKWTILNIENATKTINTSKWKITTNPIKNAIDDIDRVILDTWEDLYALKFWDDTIWDITSRIKNWQWTIKDYNDLARFYNSEFKSKIYTKKWDAKDSIIADRYENNRIWIKNFVRDNLWDDILKQLDLDYSNAAKTKQLIEKAIEWVNKLEQKIKQWWLWEKTGRLVARAIDISSMWTIRWFLTWFLPSNIWNKVNNWLDIQWELRKNIKLLQKATNQPTKSNLQKVDEFLWKIAWIKPKEWKFYVKKEQFKPKWLLPQKAWQWNKKPIILPLSDRQIIQESKKWLKPKQQPQINRELQDNKTITKSKKIKPEWKEWLKPKVSIKDERIRELIVKDKEKRGIKSKLEQWISSKEIMKQENIKKSKEFSQKVLRWEKENLRMDKKENLNIYIKWKNPEDTIIIYRAWEWVKNWDFVTINKENALKYLWNREWSKIITKKVKIKDLIKSDWIRSEFVYNPKK